VKLCETTSFYATVNVCNYNARYPFPRDDSLFVSFFGHSSETQPKQSYELVERMLVSILIYFSI